MVLGGRVGGCAASKFEFRGGRLGLGERVDGVDGGTGGVGVSGVGAVV